MTREEVKEMEKWEGHFRLALRANFVRMSASEFGEFANDYARFFPALNDSQKRCNTCRLNALKTLGKAYFDAKQEQEEEDKAKAEQEKNNSEEKPKKAGRPRKIKMEE